VRTGVVLSRAVGAEGRCACADDCGPTLDEIREVETPIAVVFWKEENERVRKPDPRGVRFFGLFFFNLGILRSW